MTGKQSMKPARQYREVQRNTKRNKKSKKTALRLRYNNIQYKHDCFTMNVL